MIQKMVLNHLGLRDRSAAGGHLHSATPEHDKSHQKMLGTEIKREEQKHETLIAEQDS